MSRWLIAQLVFVMVLVVALLELGVEIIGPGHMNPDVILPWAYVAAASWVGATICLIVRVCVKMRGHGKESDK